MRSTKRLAAGLGTAALLASGIVAVGAGQALAVTPQGGCWVYGANAADPVESTTPTFSISSALAPWTDTAAAPTGPADYTLTTSGGTTVGSSRTITLTFNKGPRSAAPASGTAYYFFSVNGQNLPALTRPFSIGAGQVDPGATVTGSFTIASSGTQNVVLRKVIYVDPVQNVRVGCNGQTGGAAAGVNPATNPVDTNVTASFATVGPTVSISSVTNQTVTTAARKGDAISFAVSTFAPGTGTAQLCDTSGANCDAGSATVTIGAGGTGTGTLNAGATPTTGNRALKVTSGSDTALAPITILADPTITTNVAGGGAGTTVTVTGQNWDPGQAVEVRGYEPLVAAPPPPASSDAPVSATANAAGGFTAQFVVNDPDTASIGASRVHAGGPPPVVLFAVQPFAVSGDTCTAKVGSATTGTCSLLESVELTIVAGDLKMSKVPGAIGLSGVQLEGTAKTSTGSLQDVTVQDQRGGTLGWSLVGTFTGLTGPAKPGGGNFAIAPSALTWTPSCTAAAGNDDTVAAGAAGAFADATTALPLCSVASPAGLGADGVSGGDTLADAALSLAVGATQAAGNYTGTLTVTLS